MGKKTEQKETKKVKVTLDVYEQMPLLAIALNQLERAKNEQPGYKFKSILPSMAFSVFSVEALCNTYGSQICADWHHFESTSFVGKIIMVSKELGMKLDFSAEPWQTINRMKAFRNNLAHAKPQKVSKENEVNKDLPNQFLPYPQPKKSIMGSSDIKEAERFYEVAKEIQTMWMWNARVKGLSVNSFGRPEYEES